jgi:2-keto-4-pentenoate hydratase/2-oxohepta-3-ene-1,7-dioic acid hydratase in catechol pathway
MKIVRYRFEQKTSYGILDGEKIREIRGDLFGKRQETGFATDLSSVQLLWPCEPSKILAVGLNYRSHLDDRTAPEKPEIFFMPVSALLEPGGTIRIPPDSKNLHYEGEMVLVIGRKTRNVSASEAKDCILGCTCGIDVSERDWQKNDLQWWRAKGCDTFAPLGPTIALDYDWSSRGVQTRLNGSVVQSGRFSELLFDPPAIVSHVSRYVTLLPGDVIYTGTPGSTRAMKSGDQIEVEVEGIGVLRNTVGE